MKKNCETCGKEFEITQWQKKKKYCSGPCSQGYYNTANHKYRKAKK
jgi:hypothetical protein